MIVLSTKQIKIRRNRICDYCLDLSFKGAYMILIEAVGGTYYMCPYCEIIKIVEKENKLFDVVGSEE
jgi:hypothetical protein